MKVLLINSVCGIGSTGRICTDIATELDKKGHTVKIAYGRDSKVPEQYKKYAVRIGSDIDVKVHGAIARLFDGSGYGSKTATKRFIKWVQEYDPDIIHLHNIHGYYINVEVLFEYLKGCGKKIIWTLHDCWAFTGHSAYCDAIDCTKWKSGCNACPQKGQYPKSFIDKSRRNWNCKKELLTNISNMTITTPSFWLGNLVKESFLSEYPIEVIHNGINRDVFTPLSNDFRDEYRLNGKIIVLGVSNIWNDMKGYNDFLRLSSMLSQDYQLVLVGLSDDQISCLPGNIIGIPKTESMKELAYIYSAADVFVNMTYCDNYPTVNLEAIACNTPIITYNTGGSAEIVNNYNVGIVVDKGSVEAVFDALKQFKNKKFNLSQVDITDSRTAIINYIRTYSIDAYDDNRGGYFSIRRRYNLIGKVVVLGVASVWDGRKGLNTMYELSSVLPENTQMIIVGLNDEQMKTLPNNVIGIERTNSTDELREIYAVADIFINPTLEDNYPTTNLESIACGTPVITFDTGGSPEGALRYGIVSEQKDAESVRKLIESGAWKLSDSINLNNIDINSMVSKIIELYDRP